jgi:flagellar motility protein MotE (MotC chaperone)
MKSVRLLPIVILAAFALLMFKGIGLMTNGGYVLLGTSTVEAAGGETPSSGAADATAADAPTLSEPTMSDSNPTADDTAPTLPLGTDDGHGDPAAAAAEGLAAPTNAIAASDACAETPAPAEGDHAADPALSGVPTLVPCDPAATNADGDALPVIMDGAGNIVPMGAENGSANQNAVIERLGERRTTLDEREQELDMRMSLVEAAEKRLAERTAVLQALEARINSLVDQNKVAEEAQFKGVVAMYETMKPKEAAAILNELDMPTLLRVASAISPRKMAPIMAKMDPVKAKDLTANMAVDQAEPTVEITGEDLAALPQIVGQ